MTQSSDARSSLLYFKRVPEGFVFRAPNPWIFGPADHYLVSETQRDAIAAILLPQRPRHAAAKLVAFALALSAGLIGMIFLLSDYIAAAGGPWLFAVTVLATTLLLFGSIGIVARRGLHRLAPILAAAPRTDYRITNAELLEFARDRSSLKQSWLIGVVFACVSLVSLGVVIFDGNLKFSFFSDSQSIGPMIQLVLFAVLAATNFRVALKKSGQQAPASPGKTSFLARRPRLVVLGSISALLAVALIVVCVGVRREFSDHTQGLRFAAKGEHDSAIASFTKAIEAYPNDPAAYAGRAESYRAKGQHDLVIADLSKRIAIGPGDANIFISRGRSFDAKGDHRAQWQISPAPSRSIRSGPTPTSGAVAAARPWATMTAPSPT